MKQLYYFIAVGERLNFSRAAESLYISQPALSQRIAELEAELEVKLLARTRKSVSLTEAGEVFLEQARDITKRLENLPQLTKWTQLMESEKKTLKVGLAVDVIRVDWFRQAVAKTIWKMKSLFSYIAVEVQEVQYTDISSCILEKDFDLCMAFHHTKHSLGPGIGMNVFYEDKIALIISKQHPANVENKTAPEILNGNVDMLLLDTNPGMQVQLNRILTELGVSPDIKYLSNENITLLQAYSGQGVFLYPKSMIYADKMRDIIDIYELEAESASVFYLGYWKRDNENTTAELFIKLLSDICRPHEQQ